MKLVQRGGVWLVLFGLCAISQAASADILNLAPAKAVLLPAERGEPTEILLQFDFSGLREGEGRQIDDAFLELRLENTRAEDQVVFQVSEILSDWDEGVPEGENRAVEIGQEPEDKWEVCRAGTDGTSGFLRLDIRSLVRQWVGPERRANHGIIVSTDDLDGEELEGQVANLRLVVRYGFIRP